MKIGIEYFKQLQQLYHAQYQIYSDAADYGIAVVDSQNRLPILSGKKFDYFNREISVFDLIKEITTNLKKQGFYFKTSSWGNINQIGGKSISFNFAWDKSEKNPKFVSGCKVTITYNVILKSRTLKFFSIDINDWEGPENNWLVDIVKG